MLPNRAMRAQIGTLIIATSCIQIGNGFFGTFISLRVTLEGFEAAAAGFVLSSYFVGFTIGALRCGNIIARIGHIRAYAAFAGLAVAATAAMPLLIGPLPWLVLRGVIGFGLAGPLGPLISVCQVVVRTRQLVLVVADGRVAAGQRFPEGEGSSVLGLGFRETAQVGAEDGQVLVAARERVLHVAGLRQRPEHLLR